MRKRGRNKPTHLTKSKMTMQKLSSLLKMGFIKLTVTIAQQQEGILSDGCFFLIQDLSCSRQGGRTGEFQSSFQGSSLSSLQEFIQTQHILAGIKNNKPTHPSPSPKCIPYKDQWNFPTVPNFWLQHKISFMYVICYFMTIPTGIMDLQRWQGTWFYFLVSECSKQFCKELE